MSETALSLSIRQGLDRLGIPNERIQCGRARGLTGTGIIHLARTGTPDIWTPYCWLETKVPGGKPTPEQRRWHAQARAHGVKVFVPTTHQQGIEFVFKCRAEMRAQGG